MLGNRAAGVIGNLSGLVQRAAHQQHAKLVAAQAGNGIRVTHPVFQQRGNFPKHVVAGQMTTGVVDHFEAIQVQIAQHMTDILAAR